MLACRTNVMKCSARTPSKRLLVRAPALAVISLAATNAFAEPGMDSRPSNLSCTAPPRPEARAVALEPAFPNIVIGGSLTIEFPSSDPTHLFAMRRQGRIYRFPNDSSTSERTTALDLRPLFAGTSPEGQSGLMDMAFHPDFSNNGELFVAYTIPGPERTAYVARFTSADGGASFSQDGEIVLSLRQTSEFHGIGSLFFGSDGYLYISFGDNVKPGDVQDPFTWYGKILRIDVDSGTPYGIPPDNPYAAGGGAPEVYALGFRNPWRVTQDSGGSGELWAGDVGAANWEEVDLVVKGGNYGWPIREGAHCRDEGCDATGLIDPVYEYSHDNGCAVIGGYVYRGELLPSLAGKYIFSDSCTGEISALERTGQDPVAETLLDSGLSVRDFSEAPDGELLIISGNEPRPMKLVPANTGGTPVDTFPTKLSETGCFDPSDPTQVEVGVIPYDVNSKLWSDGADKRRWMAIPDGTQIEALPDGDWEYPAGTVLIKEFRWNGNPFETRLMVRHDDGGWAGYTYEWNASLTDADLVSPDGLSKQIDGQLDWMYPGRSQCLQCHSAAAGRSLGLETAQLNGPLAYPSGTTSNQLETLEHIGMFSNTLGGAPEELPALKDVNDPSATLSERARSYLHSNCAGCHRPNGPGQGPMDFRFQADFSEMGACGLVPESGDLGVPGAQILTPGNSANSVMSLRIHTLGNARMPPLGSQVVDPDGTATIDAWIDSLKQCSHGEAPRIEQAFGTSPIERGETSTMTFTLTNPNAVGVTGVSFTNAYPAGMTNADPLVIGGSCLNVSTMGVAGGAALEVTGGEVPGEGSCTITVEVTATDTGTNTTSVLSTNEAPDSANGASATLTVTAAPAPPPPTEPPPTDPPPTDPPPTDPPPTDPPPTDPPPVVTPPPSTPASSGGSGGGGSSGLGSLLFLLGFAAGRRKLRNRTPDSLHDEGSGPFARCQGCTKTLGMNVRAQRSDF
jgi:uncharacterized repeat protein (TIGR03806 family)